MKCRVCLNSMNEFPKIKIEIKVLNKKEVNYEVQSLWQRGCFLSKY